MKEEKKEIIKLFKDGTTIYNEEGKQISKEFEDIMETFLVSHDRFRNYDIVHLEHILTTTLGYRMVLNQQKKQIEDYHKEKREVNK